MTTMIEALVLAVLALAFHSPFFGVDVRFSGEKFTDNDDQDWTCQNVNGSLVCMRHLVNGSVLEVAKMPMLTVM